MGVCTIQCHLQVRSVGGNQEDPTCRRPSTCYLCIGVESARDTTQVPMSTAGPGHQSRHASMTLSRTARVFWASVNTLLKQAEPDLSKKPRFHVFRDTWASRVVV